ncbi:MAG: hypothetical protein R3263_01095 [Myxococcota bacterium]|nr:hypothetical protein [Myxococcota bacterium]
MKRFAAGCMATFGLVALAALWLAAPARGNGSQQGGLPRLTAEVSALGSQVRALVGRAPGCPCYDADALRALEPALCEHETRVSSVVGVLGSVVTAAPFGQEPTFQAQALSGLLALVGGCEGPLGFQRLPYEEGKQCARLIEETLGPCVEVRVEE